MERGVALRWQYLDGWMSDVGLIAQIDESDNQLDETVNEVKLAEFGANLVGLPAEENLDRLAHVQQTLRGKLRAEFRGVREPTHLTSRKARQPPSCRPNSSRHIGWKQAPRSDAASLPRAQ
jgi:hypothetical protein